MFESVVPAPPDPILGLTDAFKQDPRPGKVNLGVGVFVDESGRTPVLKSVKAAETALLQAEQTKSYLPIGGDPVYGQLIENLLFGHHEAVASKRIRTAHTPGGTGALRVASDFYRSVSGAATAWVSRPTWPNHRGVLVAAGFEVKEYPYYNPAARGVDGGAFLAALETIPAGHLVVLHVGCHNPTGADPTSDQWRQVAAIAKKAGWMPLLDCAYIGFGDGLKEDAAPLASFAEAGVDFMMAVSFSKNMGLYNERTGALTLVAADGKAAEAAFSRVKSVIRVIYSNPPAHGGLVARRILEDPLLRSAWANEVEEMRTRIQSMRRQFVDLLRAHGVTLDLSAIAAQRGMFSLTGLTPPQIAWLKDRKAIFVVGDGRINVAGLTPKNIDYVAQSVAEALKSA